MTKSCFIVQLPPRRLAASPPRRGRLAASPWLPRRPSIAIFQKKLTKKFCPFLAASPPRRGRLAASLPRRGRLAASPWVLLLTLEKDYTTFRSVMREHIGTKYNNS